MLFTVLDRASAEMLAEKPMVDGGKPHGIFATRHISRPNRIGFSVVRLLARKDNLLLIEGVNLLNDTPVIDIKPYIPAFDAVADASSGWGGVITWSKAMGEFGAVLMLDGAIAMKTETLPIALFLNMSTGDMDMDIAAALILLVISGVTLLVVEIAGDGRGTAHA